MLSQAICYLLTRAPSPLQCHSIVTMRKSPSGIRVAHCPSIYVPLGFNFFLKRWFSCLHLTLRWFPEPHHKSSVVPFTRYSSINSEWKANEWCLLPFKFLFLDIKQPSFCHLTNAITIQVQMLHMYFFISGHNRVLFEITSLLKVP